MEDIIFVLAQWKRGNKSFQLRVSLPKKDFIGWHDYYTIDLVCNGKTKFSYKSRRFVECSDSQVLLNVLKDHIVNGDAVRIWRDFHYHKLDIQSYPVLRC